MAEITDESKLKLQMSPNRNTGEMEVLITIKGSEEEHGWFFMRKDLVNFLAHGKVIIPHAKKSVTYRLDHQVTRSHETVSIPVTNVPISEYPYYYRCESCTGAAFFLKKKPEPGEEAQASDARHADGIPVAPFEPVKCDACGKYFTPSVLNIIERPDPLGVKNDAG